jgi:hypothetical protein
MLVWMKLKEVTKENRQTIYQMKSGLLSDDLRQPLKSVICRIFGKGAADC